MREKKRGYAIAAMTSLCALAPLSGCGATQTSQENKVEPVVPSKLEPVTLRVFNAANTTQTNFDTNVRPVIESKYPHIKLELVMNQKGTTLPELIAANNVPDIYYGKIDSKEKVVIDLDPLFKKFKFDPNSIKPRLWESYAYYTGTTVKQFVPVSISQHVLHYNKDIFDKFGVPYPKDGMTWDQTYELAKRLTRSDSGVKYLGFNFRASLNLGQSPQKLLPYFDDKGQVAVTADVWKNYFTNFTRFYEIPGNELAKGELGKDTLFYKDKRVAMYASQSLISPLIEEALGGNPMNWDMVALPVFPDAPKTGSSPNTNGYGITVASRHPDDAFMAIQALLSIENQTKKAREGSDTVLANDKEILKEFGKELKGVEGKNVRALIYNEYGPSRKPNEYNSVVTAVPLKYFEKIVYEKTDVNTALRQAEEEMKQKVEAAKKAN
jgi:multiple sugar transport system substrate-binding protein